MVMYFATRASKRVWRIDRAVRDADRVRLPRIEDRQCPAFTAVTGKRCVKDYLHVGQHTSADD
jgi:hypothetical protein